jgi:C2 domain
VCHEPLLWAAAVRAASPAAGCQPAWLPAWGCRCMPRRRYPGSKGKQTEVDPYCEVRYRNEVFRTPCVHRSTRPAWNWDFDLRLAQRIGTPGADETLRWGGLPGARIRLTPSVAASCAHGRGGRGAFGRAGAHRARIESRGADCCPPEVEARAVLVLCTPVLTRRRACRGCASEQACAAFAFVSRPWR